MFFLSPSWISVHLRQDNINQTRHTSSLCKQCLLDKTCHDRFKLDTTFARYGMSTI